MPKSLVLGNGNILITLDKRGQVRDFYFPYVGLENQAGSLFVHRIGIFVDNQFSWFDDESWEIHINYQEETLVSDIQAVNTKLQVRVDLNDVVYNETNIFIRKAKIYNLADSKRKIKIFFHQEFEMYESHLRDSAYFDPVKNVIIHYKGRRVFLINAISGRASFDDFSIGNFKIEGKEGTYKDAEDGILAKNPVEHGLVDSVIAVTCEVDSQKSAEVFYWIVAAKFVKEAHQLNLYVLEKLPNYLMRTTRDFWYAWVNRQPFHFKSLDDSISRLFKKSLLIMRTHVDNRGSILASGDTDVLHHGKDTYCYLWPRDAALIALALDKSGDSPVVKKFFEFCNQVVSDEGYFMHRYRPDQSLGSSWHPWIRDGKPVLPIQEDETALIIYVLWQHYLITKDLEFIENIYNSLIKSCAEFLVFHREEVSGLPKPSYDLWEEKFGITTFTASTVYASLIAASKFASLLGKTEAENRYLSTAKEIQTAILKYLFDEKLGYFYKMINFNDKEIEIDKTIDASSIYGIWRFGVLSVTDEKVQKALKLTEEKLAVGRQVGGFARYEWDKYSTAIPETVGNPWFITSFWLAQYYIATSKNESDLQKSKQILAWAVKYALPSGVMSEQLHPETGEHISVSPLIWSHAEFVLTVIRYLEKLEELGLCDDCTPIKINPS
ncbi:glycoside hydrolase family 15 protein [Candidatus Daviesbacteria bacterium]|nr:glycoside hydrolase family 15 protein [Candidatus Daviesbacteria bacterium]